jgi:hypothetical protein
MLNLVLTLALMGPAAPPPPSVNERCPVTGIDVRNHLLYHHVTVQGRIWYVADRAAAARLKNCPECYLPSTATPAPAATRSLVPAQAEGGLLRKAGHFACSNHLVQD